MKKTGTEYVLKLYRYGLEPKAVMLEKLRAPAGEHGPLGNRAYEIL